MHDIGHAAYEKYGDFGEAMKYQDEVCNSGYLHGIIESRFSESDDVFADMKTMCDQYRSGSYMSWQCYHGIGHGLMFYTANDLPRSLKMCEGFDTDFGRSNCANGVFMENFNADQKLHISKFLKESDPFYPCAQQANQLQKLTATCTPRPTFSASTTAITTPLSSGAAARKPVSSRRALRGGVQAMKENLNDPKLVETVCMNGEDEQTAPCIEGMTSLYINHHGSLEPARELCSRLEKPNRPACYDAIAADASLFRINPPEASPALPCSRSPAAGPAAGARPLPRPPRRTSGVRS